MEQLKLDSVKIIDFTKLSHSFPKLWVNALVPITSRLWIMIVLQYGAKYLYFWQKNFILKITYAILLFHCIHWKFFEREVRKQLYGRCSREKGVSENGEKVFYKFTRWKNIPTSYNFTEKELFLRYFPMTLVLVFLRTPLLQTNSW